MTLHNLCQDQILMSELRDYFDRVLREKAIEKVFDTGEAHAVKEAKEIIDKAFENIAVQFQKKPEPKLIVNEAR